MKPFLGIGRSERIATSSLPAQGRPGVRSIFAVPLGRSRPITETGDDLSRGTLFGAGGSVSKGRIRHFNERNFDAVRSPLFTPVGDTRRLASSRRRLSPESTSRWRTLFDVLLRR